MAAHSALRVRVTIPPGAPRRGCESKGQPEQATDPIRKMTVLPPGPRRPGGAITAEQGSAPPAALRTSTPHLGPSSGDLSTCASFAQSPLRLGRVSVMDADGHSEHPLPRLRHIVPRQRHKRRRPHRHDHLHRHNRRRLPVHRPSTRPRPERHGWHLRRRQPRPTTTHQPAQAPGTDSATPGRPAARALPGLPGPRTWALLEDHVP